jgi:hypothetical protein
MQKPIGLRTQQVACGNPPMAAMGIYEFEALEDIEFTVQKI